MPIRQDASGIMQRLLERVGASFAHDFSADFPPCFEDSSSCALRHTSSETSSPDEKSDSKIRTPSLRRHALAQSVLSIKANQYNRQCFVVTCFMITLHNAIYCS